MQLAPGVHIDWSISLGNIVTVGTMIGVAVFYHAKFVILMLEHDVLKADYCKRNGLEFKDFFVAAAVTPPPQERRARARGAAAYILCKMMEKRVTTRGTTNPANFSQDDASLRELRAEFDGFRLLMAERDIRYGERFRGQETAVQAALAASKELTSAAFASSEKAIVKAEEGQREMNMKNNEFRQQLKDQAQMQMPRAEADAKFSALDQKVESHKETQSRAINDLAKSRDWTGGESFATRDSRAKVQWAISAAIGIAGLLAGILIKTATK